MKHVLFVFLPVLSFACATSTPADQPDRDTDDLAPPSTSSAEDVSTVSPPPDEAPAPVVDMKALLQRFDCPVVSKTDKDTGVREWSCISKSVFVLAFADCPREDELCTVEGAARIFAQPPSIPKPTVHSMGLPDGSTRDIYSMRSEKPDGLPSALLADQGLQGGLDVVMCAWQIAELEKDCRELFESVLRPADG